MSRLFSKRLIVFALLLCKVVTGQFMFATMAEGVPSLAPAVSQTQAAPCPEHAHGVAAGKAATGNVASTDVRTDPSPHHSGQCKSGCKCSCAHTPAAIAAAAVRTAAAPLYLPRDSYSALAASGTDTRLFRPPI